ncbi:FkbM family methyltransferase [Myxococcaceae bacterium GXIMD 01537]
MDASPRTPLPFPLNTAGRLLLRAWARTGRANGWCYQAVERYGARLSPRGPVWARLNNGCVIRCDLGDHVQQQIYFFGAYEPPEAFVFARLLRPGMTVVDAGANVGQYSLLASTRVGDTGAVHALEPVPGTRQLLQENVRRSGVRNVHVHPYALWHQRERLRLGLRPGMEANIGAFSVSDGHLGGAVEADAISLDALVEEQRIPRVDLIKMDIEGAEHAALRGMRGVLERDRPLLLMEVRRDTSERLSSSPQQLWTEIFAPLGYRAWAIGHSAHTSRALPDLDAVESSNILFYPGPELPGGLGEGWDLRTALRWARHREGAAGK